MLTVSVSVEVPPPSWRLPGVSVALTPNGTPETVRKTGCEKPLRGVTVSVTLETWRFDKVSVEGDEESEKSTTCSLIVDVCNVRPLVPVIVNR